MATVQEIYNEIDRIDNAKSGIAGAIEEKGVEVPAGAKIDEYPELVRQIQQGDTSDCVKFTPQTLTSAQKAQARNNISAAPKAVNDYFDSPSTPLYIDLDLAPSTFLLSGTSGDVEAKKFSYLAKVNDMGSGTDFFSIVLLDGDNVLSFAVGDGDGDILLKITAPSNTIIYFTPLTNVDAEFHELQDTFTNPETVTPRILQDATQVASAITAAKDVFVAEYGVTPFADILAAYNANKEVICNYNKTSYRMASYLISGGTPTYIYFTSLIASPGAACMAVKNDETWTMQTLYLERTLDKVSTIAGNETSTTKYLNCKGVADALGKMGVISQTQTWSGTGSNPRTYVMSNLVTGLIPQANIDLFESAGATFNTGTGYFELNGLTDISYEEMKVVYNRTIGVAPFNATRTNMLASLPVRTQIPMRGIESYGVSAAYCYYNSDIEVAAIDGKMSITTTSGANYIFQYARKLRAIVGVLKMSMSSAPTNPFVGCGSLQELSLSGLATNLNLSAPPNLTAASVAYMIINAGTATITITLHATAYARAIADADVQAALAAKTNVSIASA